MTFFLPVITGVICILSFFLTLRDMEKWDTEENTAEAAPRAVPRSFRIYAAAAILAVLAAAILYTRLHAGQSVWTAVKRMALLAIVWPLAYIDLKTYRIPNSFILFGLGCRTVIFVFELFLKNPLIWPDLISEAVASGALLLAGLLCALIVKNGLGFGDIKLFAVMGMLLGLEGIWDAIFPALLISFLTSVVLLITKKKTRKDAIPFGPALVLGVYLSVILSGM